MDGMSIEVLRELEELIEESKNKENAVVEIDGKKYWTKSQKRIHEDYRPDTIAVSSLTAISSYINENREGYDSSDLFLHVVSPTKVVLYEKAKGEMLVRTTILTAGLDNDLDPFEFGELMPTESFIIKLMSLFVDTEDRDKVAMIAGNLVSEKSIAGEDDGATMKYRAHKGVICTANVEIPKVVKLAPFRTFRQVEQPASTFVFRYQANSEGQVSCGLFEADGGAWKHFAMENIEIFFKEHVPSVQVIA